MRRRPAGILRRAGVKIVGAVAKRRQNAFRHDDAGGECEQPGPAQHLRLDRREVLGRHRAAERQRRIVRLQQFGERELLAGDAGEKDDGLHDVGILLLLLS
ncbi:hypothetical protein chiPu_0032947 [Chiloscyllium punctatum]|uniref:Uncharacterized protein n=1 Tax=Chiloscyllium punctatum TaxID=137246 RepID=A0A401U105_CHIPU|nr:hypothetical protein [Chiloscyllium punctatum]